MISILIILGTLSILFISIVCVSIWIHKNMKGTKIWNFVNKHIIADEDYYIK
jgi:hypothetical protein